MASRVSFNGVTIGDYAWAVVGFSGNTSVRVIPRAKGVRIYSTEEMGGGYRTITVSAYVIKQSRKDLEEYFRTLPDLLGHEAATLVVEGVSYTNCVMTGINPESTYEKWNTFTVEFLQSI